MIDPSSATISFKPLKINDKIVEKRDSNSVGFPFDIRGLVSEIARFHDFSVVLPERRIASGADRLGVFWGYRRVRDLVLYTPSAGASSGADCVS
jgi:hypothetical protein